MVDGRCGYGVPRYSLSLWLIFVPLVMQNDLEGEILFASLAITRPSPVVVSAALGRHANTFPLTIKEWQMEEV